MVPSAYGWSGHWHHESIRTIPSRELDYSNYNKNGTTASTFWRGDEDPYDIDSDPAAPAYYFLYFVLDLLEGESRPASPIPVLPLPWSTATLCGCPA